VSSAATIRSRAYPITDVSHD